MKGYHLFHGIKKHFNVVSYDYFKYHKQVRISQQKYSSLHNKYYYEKLSKTPDARNLVLSNVIINPHIQIEELWNKQGRKNYNNWSEHNDCFINFYVPDVLATKLNYPVNTLFLKHENNHPLLFSLLSSGDVPLELAVAFDNWNNFSKIWNRKLLRNDPLWEQYYFMIKKYKPFFTHDQEKLNNLFVEHF